MSTLDEDIWQAYQQTQFLLTQSFSPTLSFAIITAHNPQGQCLSPSQNRLLDRQLQRHIQAMNYPYRSLIGASRDRGHMEKSWAVTLEKAAAIALGKRFWQHAIYFVDDDELSLVPCLVDYAELTLGRFSSRVCLVNELPDIYS